MNTKSNSYSLIDSGNGLKLEQFGEYLLIRPEPAAQWNNALPYSRWEEQAHARFIPSKSPTPGINRGGTWKQFKPTPDEWPVQFVVAKKKFLFRISPSPFGHVALFPEQWENWKFIARRLQIMKVSSPKVLNLFAYTGAASVVARAFGADVVHVDSSRPILNQARQNMELNNLGDIRWVYEDAFKFVRREAKRGRKYQGIILDPPPEGRGPKGERWVLNSQLDELLGHCTSILESQNSFLMMSLYALNWPPENAAQMVKSKLSRHTISSGECYIQLADKSNTLHQGMYVRAYL